MTQDAVRIAVGAVAFMLLDGLWLGLVMNGFYRERLAPIARLSASGGFTPNWPAALVVYVALGLGLAVFAVPKASSVAAAAGYGALFGAVVYGVYDFTNYSTLRQYPISLALVDAAWGTVAAAIAAVAIKSAVR